MVNEDFLHYTWKYKLFNSDYLNFKGDKIEVLDPGLHNLSSGPDFFNARIRINDTVWAGNVEIHIKASDWFRHGHQDDPAYDNIILHMVLEEDVKVNRQSGEEIPTGRFVIHSETLSKYNHLISNNEQKDCYILFEKLDSVYYRDWIGKLGFIRLERKVSEVYECINENQLNWDDALYQFFASALGMKINAEPFRLLSRSVPLSFILKNREKQITVFAAFLGQAGFLSDINQSNQLYLKIEKEYSAIKTLLPRSILETIHWKKMRRRPGGFPIIRIIQFSEIIRTMFPLFDQLKEGMEVSVLSKKIQNCIKNLRKTFNESSEDWFSVYFPTKSTISTWIINAVVPVLFCYGKIHKDELIIQRALDILEELPAENNEILKNWNKFGIYAANAFESQALIELKNQYCIKQACTDCFLGHQVITNAGKK